MIGQDQEQEQDDRSRMISLTEQEQDDRSRRRYLNRNSIVN